MPKVITVSGKAGSGKDTFAELLANALNRRGQRVLITHYADLLKYICTTFCGWDGKKDETGRLLLQEVGTDIIREKDKNYFVNFILSILGFFDGRWDFVVIADARFENEIDLVSQRYNTISILIKREFASGLTDAARDHISENALDGYPFDIIVDNTTVDGLSRGVNVLASYLVEYLK